MKFRNAEEAKQKRDLKLRQLRRRQYLRLAVAMALLVAAAAIIISIYNSSFWEIKKIEIIDSKHIPAVKIQAMAKISTHTSLLKFQGAEVRRRLTRSHWVKDVNFSRKLPNTLIIIIKERQPFAVISQEGNFYLIDNEGFVITSWSKVHKFKVPIISDLTVKRVDIGQKIDSAPLNAVIDILSNLPANLKDKISSISVPSVSKLALYTKDNLEIVYGPPEKIKKKNLVIEKILTSGTGRIIYINVSIPENPVVRQL